MTVELLTLIIAICSTTSVETNDSSWSEFKEVQKHQKECREYFYNCVEDKVLNGRILRDCDKARELK